MLWFMFGFLIGMIVGTTIGIISVALCVASKDKE